MSKLLAIHRRYPTCFAVGLLLTISAAIHAPFHLGSSYGEQDTARLVIDALVWLKTDVRTESLSEYRYYVSPGYIWLIKCTIPLSEATQIHPAVYLNSLNLLAVILIIIPIYFLFERLAGKECAVIGILIMSFMPTFWQSGLYGFPHLPALFFLALAILLYDKSLATSGNKLLVILTLISLTISILLKGDIYLGTVSMFGLVLLRKGLSWKHLVQLTTILVMPVVITFSISSNLLLDSPQPADYFTQWNTKYEAEIWRLRNIDQMSLPFKSLGVLSIPLFCIAILMLSYKKKYEIVITLIVWSSIPLLFWLLRAGDSSRHHLQAAIPVALGIALLISRLEISRHFKLTATLAIIAINYFYFPVSNSTLVASGHLFGSAKLIKKKASHYQQMAKQYGDLAYPKKIILGSFANPYFDSEVLYRAESVSDVKPIRMLDKKVIQITYEIEGREHIAASVRVLHDEFPAIAAAFKREGYRVYSMEYDIKDGEGTKINYDLEEGRNMDTSTFDIRELKEY